MDLNHVFTLFVEVMILWLAVTVHEASHAWWALRKGDPTASEQGRASLNPLPHLDLFGTIILPIMLSALGAMVFGWGRPAPLDATKLRRPERDDVFVILAGVVANALLSLLALAALIVAFRTMGGDVRKAASFILEQKLDEAAKIAGFPVVFTLMRLVTINGFLVLFNLLPVPPLDGGRLAMIYLPPDWAQRLAALRPYPRTVATLLGAFLATPPFLLFSFLTLQFIIAVF